MSWCRGCCSWWYRVGFVGIIGENDADKDSNSVIVKLCCCSARILREWELLSSTELLSLKRRKAKSWLLRKHSLSVLGEQRIERQPEDGIVRAAELHRHRTFRQGGSDIPTALVGKTWNSKIIKGNFHKVAPEDADSLAPLDHQVCTGDSSFPNES